MSSLLRVAEAAGPARRRPRAPGARVERPWPSRPGSAGGRGEDSGPAASPRSYFGLRAQARSVAGRKRQHSSLSRFPVI